MEPVALREFAASTEFAVSAEVVSSPVVVSLHAFLPIAATAAQSVVVVQLFVVQLLAARFSAVQSAVFALVAVHRWLIASRGAAEFALPVPVFARVIVG